MTELKDDLASLRIDHAAAPPARRRWPWLAGLLVLGLGLGTWVFPRLREGRAVEVETASASVALSGDDSAAGTPLLTASGYVVARRKAVVSAKIQGRLEELRVEEGSRVAAGSVLARLESRDYAASTQAARAGVQRAAAELAESQRQARLADEMHAQQVVARDFLDAATSRVRLAEAALAQAEAALALSEAQLEHTVIRAPFSGVVVKKMAEVGESVAPIPPGVNLSTSSGAIVALADLDTLEVEADVAEANVARLGDAQPAEVTVEAFPDRRYKAILRQVIPTADRTKATVMVKVTILEKDRDLKPEMSAKVSFLERPVAAAAGSADAVARSVSVPKDTLATLDGQAVVFEVVAGRVRRRPVTLGAERQGQVVVRQGLIGSETLVLRPPAALRDGDAVRIKS